MPYKATLMYSITVFTPTYNRAYILPQLYRSLLRQTAATDDFEWLIIDDGSTDDTETIVGDWIDAKRINIKYHKVTNGGKPRAINLAVELARSPFMFIVDSDDYLTDDAVEFMIAGCREIASDPNFVGVGGLRGRTPDDPLGAVKFDGPYINATNIERAKYGLDVDCNEAYKIDILKRFPFPVWEGENFAPESLVLNEMALCGYKLRWHNKVIVISEYLEDGMTKGAWNLMKRNPMGYAMLYNHTLKYRTSLKDRIYNATQMIAQSILGHNPRYIFKSNAPIISIICFPIGIAIAVRRHFQYRRN